jgi:hypothetical protein
VRSASRPLLAFLAATGLGVVAFACATELAQRFPHSTHLTGFACGEAGEPECLSCPSCHQGTADTGEHWARPPVKVCKDCHPREREKQVLPERPSLAPRPAAYAISFNHDQHLEMDEIRGQCVRCHAGAVSSTPGRLIFPPMSTCLNCHQHAEEFAATKCAPCHATNEVRTLKPVTFLPHDAAWMKRHGSFVREDAQSCLVCHAQTQCDSCHDANQGLRVDQRNPDAITREFVHRFDFQSRHAIEARSQPGQCSSCHTRQDCDACHVQRGVSGGLVAGRNPHPLGWAAGLGAASNLHGQEARRDIASCAACHDQGPFTNCIRCHKVGGIGGNPHPPGWRSSQATDSTSCAACHGGL